MPPNARVAKAFHAMRVLGIPEEKTKPILKKLLKLYDKNWELIEEENYRTLADAIFETEETQEVEKKRIDNTEKEDPMEGTLCQEESDRALKRLRLRHQEVQASAFFCNPDLKLTDTTLKKPKLEEEEPVDTTNNHSSFEAAIVNQSYLENTRVDSSGSPVHRLTRSKGKQLVNMGAGVVLEKSVPIQPDVMKGNGSHSMTSSACPADHTNDRVSQQGASGEGKTFYRRSSRAVRLKEPKIEPGIDSSPKQNLPSSQILIKPKDEPFTDDMQLEVPIAAAQRASSSKQDSSLGNHSVKASDVSMLYASQSGDGEGKTYPPSSTCEMATGHDHANVPANSTSNLMDVSKSLEEETTNVTSSMDLLKKKCSEEGLAGGGVCFPPSNVSTNMHRITKALRFLPPSDNIDNGVEPNTNDNSNNGEVNMQNGLKDANQHCQLSPLKSLHGVEDIAKGQEKIKISLVNDVNNEAPPSFHYVPKNVVYQNAYLNFSLARIGDGSCCPDCYGSCLSSSISCACANETGGDFAYTSDGLVKDAFLKECVSMNRDPEKHCMYYCKECPIERSKNEGVLESCKGHLVRKFIKECWYKCGCSKNCGNRVVQRGINCNLQVFMTPEGKGWGLRTLEDLPKGAFVCEYVGEVLTNTELFDRVSQNPRGKGHSYPVLLDADWGSEVVLKDEEALCLDATYYGNVARFINHRCGDSNLVEIPVEVETPDHHYYHLAFFTTRKVKALEELTWDYGIDFDDHEHPVKAFHCCCGSKFCRNIKRSSRSRSAATRKCSH